MQYHLNSKGFSMIQEFEKIKKGEMTTQQVANIYGYHVKTIQRKYKKYINEGVSVFIHKNSNRTPHNKLSEKDEKRIIDLFVTEYMDLGTSFTQFIEIVKTRLNIDIKSRQHMHKIFKRNGIISPYANRSTKKDFKKQKNTDRQSIEINSETIYLKENDYVLYDTNPHPTCCRNTNAGSIIQMDTGFFEYEGIKYALHIAVDYATKTIVGGYFDSEETTMGYFQVLKQILENYGIPKNIITDNRSTFRVNRKKASSIENDALTNFQIACNHFGISIYTSSIPQHKGCVERMVGTIKRRIKTIFYEQNVTSIEEANNIISDFLNDLNTKFALHINNNTSEFKFIEKSQIDNYLCWHYPRVVQRGNIIKFENKNYKLSINKTEINLFPGRKGFVIKNIKGDLYYLCCSRIYVMVELNQQQMFQEKEKLCGAGTLAPRKDHPYCAPSYEKMLHNSLKNMKHLNKKYINSILRY